MNKTVGILAHVDAGKTTLSEQILYRSGVLREAGRVDTGSAHLDFDTLERRRGITIYSGVASFRSGEHTYYLIDTPGHVDFSAEMERTLSVLDFAVLVVSCVEGVQAHTEVIWKLLETYRVPTLFFLNKTDRVGADVDRTLSQIRAHLTGDAVLLDEGMLSEAEELASRDESLLEFYLSEGFDETRFRKTVSDMTERRRLFPCFSGAALQGEGVLRLIDAFDRFTDTRYSAEAPLSAVCWKVSHDKSGGKVCFVKLTGGVLHVKDVIKEDKIHEIRLYNGQKYIQCAAAEAGQICALTGVDLHAGDVLGDMQTVSPTIVPLLLSTVLFDRDVPIQTVLSALRTVEQEEPEIQVHTIPSAQKIQISTMGEIQLEVLREHVQERFGIEISFGECEILYRETIQKSVTGCGHFEPLRHYAEVHVLLRPLPRGSGIRFSSACSTDVLRTNWQRLIETHVFEKQHVGAMCGFPLTDVEVVLLAGRAHEKHTEGGDFRQATYRAIRNALFSAEMLLLEPYYRYSVRVPSSCVGRVLSDLEQMSATYDAPLTDGEDAMICGRCPVSEMLRYKPLFTALTKGRGVLSVQYDGYDRCHDPHVVTEKYPYDREADTENTADSVFCSHGAGYTVKWNEAPSHMHCTVNMKNAEV